MRGGEKKRGQRETTGLKGGRSRTSVIQSCVLIIHAPKDGEEATGIAFPVDRRVKILLQFNC